MDTNGLTPRGVLLSELEKLLTTRAGRLYGSWMALNDAWSVFEANASTITNVECRINDSPRAMLEIASIDGTERDVVLTDLKRRLHNLLAAVVSFDDQTTGHVKRFYRTGDERQLSHEFKSHRAAMFQRAPLCAVARELRNVAMHFSLPEVRVQFSVSAPEGGTINDPGTSQQMNFQLDCQHAALLIRESATRSSKSKAEALDFFDQVQEDYPLTDFTNTLVATFREIHEWLRDREVAYAGQSIAEFIDQYNDLVDRYNSGEF